VSQRKEFQRCEAGNPTIWLPTGRLQSKFVVARLAETDNRAN